MYIFGSVILWGDVCVCAVVVVVVLFVVAGMRIVSGAGGGLRCDRAKVLLAPDY